MGMMCQLESLRRAGAVLLVVAVAVLPMLHATPTHASAGCGDDAVVGSACCGDPCATCSDCEGTCCPSGEAAVGDTSDGEQPMDPASDDDRPCDCPCCGKVVPVVTMISPTLADAPFLGELPTLVPIARDACPDSVAMRVDIQPPIV